MKKQDILQTIERHYLEAKDKASYYLEMSLQYPDEKYWQDEASTARAVWYGLYCLMQDLDI